MAITAYQMLVFKIRQDLYKKIPKIQGEQLMKVVKKEKWICKMSNNQEQSAVKFQFLTKPFGDWKMAIKSITNLEF